MNMFKKVFRYILMYGPRRTAVKVLYNFDNFFSYTMLKTLFNYRSKLKKRIVFIGLGNHGFTLLAFFVCVIAKQKISIVIDPSEKSKKLSERVLGSKHYPDLETAISDGEFFGDIVYIASDHSSHTKHAVISSNNFKNVYVEKPLFVNEEQMMEFGKLLNKNCNLFSGFNRPFSPFFRELSDLIDKNFSVTIVVNGHFLESNHWYRDDGQGSRVLGNLTHWIDLSLRIFHRVNENGTLKVMLSKGEHDDIVLTFKANSGKVCLSFSANCEPKDGVEEFLFWNCSTSLGSIMNFREMSYITNDGSMKKISKFSKNVGHELASLAPIYGIIDESNISYLSSKLALKVFGMYVNDKDKCEFSLKS